MEIQISGKNGAGKVLLIDEGDVGLLQGKPVYMTGSLRGKDYLYPTIALKGRGMQVHKVIAKAMGLSGEIDHVNRDKCDARRQNLRAVTRSQNMRNNGLTTPNKSGLKGVSWDKRYKKWRAQIQVKGRKEWLGYFTCKFAAARVYDHRALEVEPIHAATNASLGRLPDTPCHCQTCHNLS
jgi:HNH endonuclease/AP2 domain